MMLWGWHIDPVYLWIFVITLLISIVAQTMVSSAYRKWSGIKNGAGLTGGQVGQRIIQRTRLGVDREAPVHVETPELKKLADLRVEAREKIDTARTPEQREKRKTYYQKRIERAQGRIDKAHEMLDRARNSAGKIKAQIKIASQKRTLNLGTSLKSYIDPRVYHHWGQQVEYDVLERYYPKALRRKFAWVREASSEDAK